MLSIHHVFGLPRSRLFLQSNCPRCVGCGCTIWGALSSFIPWLERLPVFLGHLLSSQSEWPPEHLNLQGLFMLLGRWPAFCSIYGNWAHDSPVDLRLNIFWLFFVAQDPSDLSPPQPLHFDSWVGVWDGIAVQNNQGSKISDLSAGHQCWLYIVSLVATLQVWPCWAAFWMLSCILSSLSWSCHVCIWFWSAEQVSFASATLSAYNPPVRGQCSASERYPCVGIAGQLLLCPYKGWTGLGWSPVDANVTLKDCEVPAGHQTTLLTVQYSNLTHLTYSFAFYCI